MAQVGFRSLFGSAFGKNGGVKWEGRRGEAVGSSQPGRPEASAMRREQSGGWMEGEGQGQRQQKHIM